MRLSLHTVTASAFGDNAMTGPKRLLCRRSVEQDANVVQRSSAESRILLVDLVVDLVVDRVVDLASRAEEPVAVASRYHRSVTELGVAAWLAVGLAPVAEGFPTQDETSVGTEAMRAPPPGGGSFAFRLDVGYLEGSVAISPTSSETLDRRLSLFLRTGINQPVNKTVSVRFMVKALGQRRLVEEVGGEADYQREDAGVVYPELALTVGLKNGLEAFGGLVGHHFPIAKVVKETEVISSEKTTAATTLVTPFVGVMRRTKSWGAGVFVLQGDEAEVGFTRQASDDSQQSATTVYYRPTTYGVFAGAGGDQIWGEAEALSIAAGEGGPRSPDGNPKGEDYLRARVLLGWGIAPKSWGMEFSGMYQTLAYSQQEFTDLNTIPYTALRWVNVFGSRTDHLYLGLHFARGFDEQSLPTLNATYEALAGAVLVGGTATF